MRAFFLLLLPALAHGQEAGAFLKAGVGARALGMGGAYTALADEIHASAWNPAGLAAVARTELGVSHAELPAGSRFDFLGVAHRTFAGTLSASGLHLSHGSLEGRDAQGRQTGDFSAADSAVALGFARAFGATQAGVNAKYVRSTIGDASATTFAFDLGARQSLAAVGPGTPMLGLAVQNLGPGLRYADERSALPLTVAAGAAYRLTLGVTIAADFKHRPNSRSNEVAVGTEYAFLRSFAVRAGYGSAKVETGDNRGLGSFNGFAAGFGLKLAGYSLDYSMTPFGELGNVQRFTLGAKF